MSTASTSPESPTVRWTIGALTVIVCLAVTIVLYALPKRDAGHGPSLLAAVNALLNGSAAVLLCLGYAFIRRRNLRAHRACMLAAFGVSSAFLVSYLIHHAQVGSVPFRGVGAVRWFYFGLLIPHILLAAVVVPMALFTIYRGWHRRVAEHRRIARVTLPIWMFVSVSGVLLYFMLYHL